MLRKLHGILLRDRDPRFHQQSRADGYSYDQTPATQANGGRAILVAVDRRFGNQVEMDKVGVETVTMYITLLVVRLQGDLRMDLWTSLVTQEKACLVR